MIMHLPPTTFYKPKNFFGSSVKKAQCNQIAYEVIQRIREDDKAREAAEKARGHIDGITQPATDEPIQVA